MNFFVVVAAVVCFFVGFVKFFNFHYIGICVQSVSAWFCSVYLLMFSLVFLLCSLLFLVVVVFAFRSFGNIMYKIQLKLVIDTDGFVKATTTINNNNKKEEKFQQRRWVFFFFAVLLLIWPECSFFCCFSFTTTIRNSTSGKTLLNGQQVSLGGHCAFLSCVWFLVSWYLFAVLVLLFCLHLLLWREEWVNTRFSCVEFVCCYLLLFCCKFI